MSDSILAQPGERNFGILSGLNNTTCLEAALFYASLGWPVLPIAGVSKSLGCCRCSRGYACGSPGKHPLTAHGLKDASTDPEIIRGWFRQWAWINVGIVTGAASGLVVVDVDNPSSTLRFDTLRVDTSGNKHHFYFALDGQEVRSSVSKVAPGVDVRGEGGYVVAPPSDHKSGGQYQWRPGTQLAPFPTELLLSENPAPPPAGLIGGFSAPAKPTTKVGGAAKPKPDPQPQAATIAEGQRNSELFKIASAMRGRGQIEAEILVELLKTNEERCQPPLSEDEIRRIAASAARQESVQTAEQIIRKLAKMPPIEYDKNREAAVEELGIRVTTLDEEVKKERGLISAKMEEQRDQAEWERVKAGPKEDGAQLLVDIASFVKRFLYLSEAQYTIVALWVLHTHVLPAFDFSPYLNTWSATKGCGKSRLLEVLKLIVARPWYTMRTTASALLRKVADTQLADDRSAHIELLRDIRDVFKGHGGDKITTETLLHNLTTTGKRWSTCDRGRPLNARGLAEMLKPLCIHPRDVRIGTSVLKGYRLEDFSEAFAAYLSAEDESKPVEVTELPSLAEMADSLEEETTN